MIYLRNQDLVQAMDGPAKKCKRKRFNIESGRSVTEANMYNEEVQNTEPNNQELNNNKTELNKNNGNYETEANG